MYKRQVTGGDPVNEWQAHMERLSTLRDKMNALDLESVHFESSNGTDLTVGLADQAVWESAASKSEKGVVFPDISYGFYEVFADLYHIDVLRPKMGAGLTIDPADYTGTGRCVVIANPNAQTGVALPLEAVEGIVKGSPESVVVVDEAYVDFGGETAAPLVEKYPNVLVVRTFSKSASLAGARLGYALGAEKLIEDLKKLKYSTNPYSVNRTALIAGAAAIRDWSYSAENCRSIASERERLASELAARGFELTDSRTNFVLAKPRGIGAKEYMEALRERGILIRYLGGALSDWVRITIGTPEQMDALLDATDEILKRS